MKNSELTGTMSAILAATLVSVLSAPAIAGIKTVLDGESLPGGSFVSVVAMSGNGKTFVGSGNSVIGPKASMGREAFRWTAGSGLVGLGDLSGGLIDEPENARSTNSVALGVSADGSVVVGQGSFIKEFKFPAHEPDPNVNPEHKHDPVRVRMNQAFRSGGGNLSRLKLSGGGNYDVSNSIARAASADGSVVVGDARRSHFGDEHYTPTEAVLWKGSGGTGLGYLPSENPFSEAWGVSADGKTVVGRSSTGAFVKAFRWTEEGGMVALDGASQYSLAAAVSADGSVIVGEADNRAFRWTEDGGMSFLSDDYSYSVAVSDDGETVAGTAQSGQFGSYEAFLWTAAKGTRSVKHIMSAHYGFDMVGWNLTGVASMSSDGKTIMGYGVDPYGQNKTWVAKLPSGPTVPEPATALLLSFGSLVLLKRKW